jgi:SAM-dependent MidA family methyltransferase
MTPLADRIARRITAAGPMPLAEYMAVCLGDPKDGYYARADTIGAGGDFITAPEVSQMFGELIAVWCYAAWQAIGRPGKVMLAEAGPGKGTLLADLLRTVRRFADFASAIDLHLIEASETMIARQREVVAAADFADRAHWHTTLAELPDLPTILVANEFLDVLPIRQYVKAGEIWHERCVGLADDGALVWKLGPALIDPSLLPPGAVREPDGAVFETAPAREAWIAMLGEKLAQNGGMALLIDYGHAETGFGDTFQAMRGHAHADPLAEPGLADLTSHVDFTALARAAASAGSTASAIADQGEFLLAMGLAERAGTLGAHADEMTRKRLRSEAERLARRDQMGSLFKVLALAGRFPQGDGPDLPPFTFPTAIDVRGS